MNNLDSQHNASKLAIESDRQSKAEHGANFQTCNNHSGSTSVLYYGPACPFCLVLDDLDFTRRDLERATQQLTNSREGGSC